MQYDISESCQKDSEMAEAMLENEKSSAGIGGNSEDSSDNDDSDSDSDNAKEVGEDTTVIRPSENKKQKPAELDQQNDSLFEGGVSQWYDV